MKVLIVDDNANDRKLLRLNLEKHGCGTVIEARDGLEGLDMAKAQRPDLIISDALMPGLDGFEFLRAVKTDEALAAIPFVFHSSVYTGSRDEELASRLGAEAFITKPKEPEEFWEEIHAILEKLAAGTKKPLPSEPMEEEQEYLRAYSNVVAAKLEVKVRELEESLARRYEVEVALRKSERFLNNIIENIPDMIFVKDARELRFIRVNKAGEELLGFSREELMGKGDHDFFPPQEAAFFTGKDREVIDSGRSVDIPEETIRTRHNGTRILHTKKIPIPDEMGATHYLLGISEDITERKRAEEELLKLSSAIEQSPVSVVITDAKGNIEFVNPKFTEITGYEREEALGLNPRILKSGETPPEEYRKLWDTLSSGNVWHGEFHNKKKNGELFWEFATISPVKDRQGVITHYIAIKEDITNRKRLEEQLRHSQKMEAVGTLAGGVAHDFNNMLTAIIGFGSILDMKMAQDDPLRPNVAHILTAADRAANLTRSLLTFSRPQPVDTRQMDLNDIVNGIEKMLHRLIREDIEVRMDLFPGRLPVRVDVGQIEQVLLNLATNARDAIPGVGTITISTELTELDEEFNRTHGYGIPGRYAMIAFADTGAGMDENTRERIFEPFFTTKEVGKGTGLGLSICYGIVKQHGGYIICSSEPGLRTTFRIYLPLSIGERETAEHPEPSSPRGGTETILLAEDDATVRELTRQVLEEFGYRVIEAANGVDAVSTFTDRVDEIQLLLCDLIMPKMNGREVLDEVRKLSPDIRSLFVSGYAADTLRQKGLMEEGMIVAMKPISPLELLRKVREVLDTK